jgi:N-acetylmuramoyl-L-alanine amidase
MTLQLALLVENDLKARGGDRINVFLTRRSDVNLGLSARANVARSKKADIFLSIHFNDLDGSQRGRGRGVSAHVRTASNNVNLTDDTALARRIQQAVFRAIRARDSTTRDRGIVQSALGVLSDPALGNTASSHRCRACLLEVEFIDVPAVDALLNTGPNAARVRCEIAAAIGSAIYADLAAHP